MLAGLCRFLADEDGVTAVEYAVLLALIMVVAIVGISWFGQSTGGSFGRSGDQIGEHMSRAGVDLD